MTGQVTRRTRADRHEPPPAPERRLTWRCRQRGAARVSCRLARAAIANPKRVQALAGHASITMTLDRYGKHMNLGADETAAEVTRFLEKHGG